MFFTNIAYLCHEILSIKFGLYLFYLFMDIWIACDSLFKA